VALSMEKAKVTVDPERLRVIVDNLFTNAVKFSPVNAFISIELHVEKGEVTLTIQDQGPGIPVEEQNRIFEAFFQGSVQANKQYSGTGLGLAIASDYAIAIGATLTLVASDTGACFKLVMPVSL